jgi:RNA recognition motif-containing protein
MHGKILPDANGDILPGTMKRLYVAEAKTKLQRQRAIEHESYKYKLSRKRCNLFVRNFPDFFTEADLRHNFLNFGEIESLRFQPAIPKMNKG